MKKYKNIPSIHKLAMLFLDWQDLPIRKITMSPRRITSQATLGSSNCFDSSFDTRCKTNEKWKWANPEREHHALILELDTFSFQAIVGVRSVTIYTPPKDLKSLYKNIKDIRVCVIIRE